VRLHTPLTMPEVAEYGMAVMAGTEPLVEVTPSLIHSLEDIREFSREKRQCHFQDEYRLAYFRNYTYANCFQECLANYTFKVCGFIIIAVVVIVVLTTVHLQGLWFH
jgi:acid-sensing ion channel, other